MLKINFIALQQNYQKIVTQKKSGILRKQGRKRPLDTPKRMMKRREREGKRE
jgi:hypothetical protein